MTDKELSDSIKKVVSDFENGDTDFIGAKNSLIDISEKHAEQFATEAINKDARTVTYDTEIQAEAVAICHRRIIENIKNRLE